MANMKTYHSANDIEFNDYIKRALREVGITGHFKRVIPCGAGVVILRDTNRTENCGIREIHKALHLPNDALSPRQEPEYQDTIFGFDDDSDIERVLLTPDQIRLMHWLEEHCYLREEMNWQALAEGVRI